MVTTSSFTSGPPLVAMSVYVSAAGAGGARYTNMSRSCADALASAANVWKRISSAGPGVMNVLTFAFPAATIASGSPC